MAAVLSTGPRRDRRDQHLGGPTVRRTGHDGALNLYSTRPDAFDDTDVAFAAVFATHAAVAMDSARREANLERKADTRDLIGRAKGIVMSLEHVTDDKAFHMLRDASQRLNVKLTTIAQQVNETGQLPE